jgi:hypothetical protein
VETAIVDTYLSRSDSTGRYVCPGLRRAVKWQVPHACDGSITQNLACQRFVYEILVGFLYVHM